MLTNRGSKCVVLICLLSFGPISALAQRPQPSNGSQSPPISVRVNGQLHATDCTCPICQQTRARYRNERQVTTAAPTSPASAAPTRPAPTDKDVAATPTSVPTSPASAAQTRPAPTDKDVAARSEADIRSDVARTIRNSEVLTERVKADVINHLTSTPETAATPPAPSETDSGLTSADRRLTAAITTDADAWTVALTGQTLISGNQSDLSAAAGTTAPALAMRPDAQETPKRPSSDDGRSDGERPVSSFTIVSSTDDDKGKYEVPATEIGITVGGSVSAATTWDTTRPVPFGKLVQFWVKPMARRPDLLRSVAYAWTILPKEDVIIWPDATRIILSSGSRNQTYTIILTASYVYLDGTEIHQRTGQAVAILTVGDGSAPQPPGRPDPGLTGLAKLSYDWTAHVIRSTTYTEDKVRADAARLAAVFNNVAAKVESGALTDVNTIMHKTREGNDAAIENRNEWLPWFTKMSDYLKAAYADGSIRAPMQYAAAWRQIAKGLEAASR